MPTEDAALSRRTRGRCELLPQIASGWIALPETHEHAPGGSTVEVRADKRIDGRGSLRRLTPESRLKVGLDRHFRVKVGLDRHFRVKQDLYAKPKDQLRTITAM